MKAEDAVIIEDTVQEAIEKVVGAQIAKMGVKEEFQAFANECLAVKVLSVDDKEGYKVAKEKLKEATKKRTATEAKRKEIKAPVISEGKKIDAVAEELQKILSPGELHLIAECKKVEDHEALQLKLKEEARVKKIAERRAEVMTYSPTATTDGYAIGTAAISTREIEAMVDSDFSARMKMFAVQSEAKKTADAELDAKLKRLEALEAKEKEGAVPVAPATEAYDPFADDVPIAPATPAPKPMAPGSYMPTGRPSLPPTSGGSDSFQMEPQGILTPVQLKLREIITEINGMGLYCTAGKFEHSAVYRDLLVLAGLAK